MTLPSIRDEVQNVHPSPRARHWPIVAVFIAMAGLQACVAMVSIELLSSVRAFVAGESLYSKGQKDAQIYLLDYAEKHREEDYARFMAALAVPLGDRVAREALQLPEPDLEKARQGFLDGGNHPDDIEGSIRMFRWFQRLPMLSKPIAAWTEADRVIEQMRGLVDRARERILARDVTAASVVEMRVQAPVLNAKLTELESTFSELLGEASRTTQRLLLALNAVIAILLTVAGLGFVRRSARVQASTEAEVVSRQESLQRLLDSTAEGLYGTDVQGRCTFINKAALTMLGYDREADLLGRAVDVLIHRSHAQHQKAHTTRQALHSVDQVFWRRDGSSFPVEYWSHPIVHDGEVQGAVATFFDISERIEMQAALRRGEMRMERLIDAVTDGVVTIDQDQRVVLFNRAAEAMFRTAAPEAIGSPIERFIDGAGNTRLLSLPEESSASSVLPLAVPLRELIGKRFDGQQFPVEASLSRLETERGPLTTAVLRDVTALHAAQAEKRAREAVEATSRAKTDFLSRMSHELRTPLNAVIGFAQLLRMDASRPLSSEQLERVERVESAGEHLLTLVNDVLDLSRIESGEMSVTRESIALSAVIEEAATMVSPLVSEAGVEIFMRSRASVMSRERPYLFSELPVPGAAEVWVDADRVRLKQVLVNLLSNAVKYNRPGGSVVLNWKAANGRCEVSVIDTGQGISPDQLTGLFEPFNRLGAEASKVEGTGIGLVLSRQLAEMMGGSLTISSVFGEGTTALLTLAAAVAPDALLRRAPLSAAGRDGGTLHVLYAEDNEVNAELMRQIVRLRPSVSLRVAENGNSALEMAAVDPPDLMLIDMNLGDMTGIDLAHALHRDRSTREIRMFALSADALPEQIDAAMRCGFEGYLTKPIKFEQLLALFDGDEWSVP
jgi:PAS domain S-box-containing protein